MSDLPPPVSGEPPAPKRMARGPIWLGFFLGAVPWLLTFLPLKDYGAVVFLIFACFAMPVIAAIIALIPKTRPFGLGLLLATGLGWLILGALCSGFFR